MTASRRLTARVANVGLILFGLALIIVLSTGGTRIEMGFARLSMRHVGNPLLGFAVFAALRLLVAKRTSGLESRVVSFFARQGVPPRDARATPLSVVRAGALLGAGWGLVCGVADLTHLWLTTQTSIAVGRFVMVVGVEALAGGVGGAIVGSLLGLLTWWIGRLFVARPGRYQAGRWCLAALWVVGAALVAATPPSPDPAARAPTILLTVAGAFFLAAVLFLLLVPAAMLRARTGRWGLAVLAGASLTLALGMSALAAFGPTTGPSGLGSAAHPNILVISVPGLRPEGVGLYSEVSTATPAIDALGARGAVFTEAIAPTTQAVPLAVSMMTGLYPKSHGIRSRDTPWELSAATLPETLSAHGYHTGAFISSPAWAGTSGPASTLSALFHVYDDPTGLAGWLEKLVLVRPWIPEGSARQEVRSSVGTFEAFAKWLNGLPRGPWFAWVQISEPLRPGPGPPTTEAPAETWGSMPLGIDPDMPLPVRPAWADPDAPIDLRSWMSGYQASIQRTDRVVHLLNQMVWQRGEGHSTIVTVLSEGGIGLGEDELWFDRGSSLAEPMIHVPWVISGPGVSASRLIPGPCSLVDVSPTLLGLVGLGGGRESEGEDLSRHLMSLGSVVRSHRSGPVFAESTPQQSGAETRSHAVRLGPWKLVREHEGTERLFFVAAGVEEEILVPEGRAEREKDALSEQLSSYLERYPGPL